jgi:hypothetical protein
MVEKQVQVRVTHVEHTWRFCYCRTEAESVSLAPSVTVCAVTCVRLMTGVSHEGLSDELWRFSTSSLGWERVDSTATNGGGPSPRYGHVMISVGLDLWVHGGSTYSGEGDTC